MNGRSRHEEQVEELQGTLTRLRGRVTELAARLDSAAVALNDATDRLEGYDRVLDRLEHLHAPHDVGLGPHCITCDDPWPCASAAALGQLDRR